MQHTEGTWSSLGLTSSVQRVSHTHYCLILPAKEENWNCRRCYPDTQIHWGTENPSIPLNSQCLPLCFHISCCHWRQDLSPYQELVLFVAYANWLSSKSSIREAVLTHLTSAMHSPYRTCSRGFEKCMASVCGKSITMASLFDHKPLLCK